MKNVFSDHQFLILLEIIVDGIENIALNMKEMKPGMAAHV